MRRGEIFVAGGMFLPPGLVIGLYIYIGIFNRLLGDDYCSMYIGRRLGLLRSIWHWYRTWHGGFSASAADWLLSLFGPAALPFHTFVFLSAWVAFTVIAVRKAFLFRGYSRPNFFLTLLPGVLLVFITLAISPDISQSLFWWGGVRSYLSPLVLIVLYFALYFHFASLSPNRMGMVIWLIVSFGLAFFIGGFSETFTPVLVILLAGLAGIRWLASKFDIKDAALLFLGTGFIGALTALFVMVLAPGNSIRQSYFPVTPSVFTILSVASASYLTFLFDILSSPKLISGFLGCILGLVWLGMEMSQDSRVTAPPGWWIIAFLFAGIMLAFGCFIPAVYGTSEPPPARTLITPAFLLASSCLASGFVLGEWLASRVKNGSPVQPALSFIACVLILFSSWVAIQNLYSIRAEHVSFAEKWDRVDAEIKAAKNSGLTEIHIPSLKNWAGVDYPTDNPKFYPNKCSSNFYDINILAPPP